ncbi:MAG: hypothetical protein FJ150_02230, partial [Euryarchaeota archaeon]|nr:hypothetical protein [Euryarchaeota archaeon]
MDLVYGTIIMLFLPGLFGGLLAAYTGKNIPSKRYIKSNLRILLSILVSVGFFYYLVSLLVLIKNMTSPSNDIGFLSPYTDTGFMPYIVLLIICSAIPAFINKEKSLHV